MQQDLDRVIDEAAQQIVSGEPSDALGRAVMARVRGSDHQTRRFVWAAAGAGAVACGLIAFLMLNRIPPQVTEAPKEPHPAPAVVAATAPTPTVSPSTASSAEPVVRAARQVVLPGIPPEDDVFTDIEPIAVDSISSDPIDVPPVQVVAVDPIAQIQVEPLIIEPLPTANN